MNASLSLSSSMNLFLLLVAAILCAGCDKPSTTAPPAPPVAAAPPAAENPSPAAAAAPKFVDVESNSFAAVTAQLDPGGSFYLYLGTEQWLRGLSTKLGELKKLLSNLPNMGQNELAGISKGFDVLTHLVSGSGLEEISGLGVSAVAREKDLYRSRIVVHHYPGNNKGFIWSLSGAEPHPLETLELLPAATALAVSSDFNLSILWNLIDQEVKASGIPEAAEAIKQVRQLIQSKYNLELEKLLASAPGPFLVALTLDPVRTFSVPAGGLSLKIPEPGLVILAKVKDESLYDLVEKSLPPDAPVVKTNKPGLKMQSMPLPMGLPFSPTVAQAGDYFLLSSHPKHIEELLSVKQGTTSGLKSTPEFKRLSADIPLTGNQFTFLSERLGRTLTEAIRTALESATNNPGAASVQTIQNFFGGQKMSFAVGSNTPEGWVVTANGNQHPGALAAAPMVVAPTAIAAGLLLPALAKAKQRAQSISCVSNMKQICLAALIYSNDHQDVFPASFLTMTNELNTPKILVCPQDTAHKRPESNEWSLFDTNQISYEFVSPGTKQDVADRVLIRCPIHGHVGLSDGSVHPRSDR